MQKMKADKDYEQGIQFRIFFTSWRSVGADEKEGGKEHKALWALKEEKSQNHYGELCSDSRNKGIGEKKLSFTEEDFKGYYINETHLDFG